MTWETLGEAAGGVFSLPKYQINWQLEWMKSGDRWEPHLSQPYCGDAQGELAYSKNSSSSCRGGNKLSPHSSGGQKSKISIPGPKSKCQQGHTPSDALGGHPFFASFSFWWLQTLLGLWPHHFSPCLCGHMLSLLYMVNLPLPLLRTRVNALEPTWINQNHLLISGSSLCKAFFSSRETQTRNTDKQMI